MRYKNGGAPTVRREAAELESVAEEAAVSALKSGTKGVRTAAPL